MSRGNLKLPLPNRPLGDPSLDINALYDTIRELEDIISKLLPFSSISSSGLGWEYNGGNVAFGDSVYTIAPAIITLAANATSYVEVDTSGNVQVNNSGFTAGRIPIAQIITNQSAITSYADKRALLRR